MLYFCKKLISKYHLRIANLNKSLSVKNKDSKRFKKIKNSKKENGTLGSYNTSYFYCHHTFFYPQNRS